MARLHRRMAPCHASGYHNVPPPLPSAIRRCRSTALLALSATLGLLLAPTLVTPAVAHCFVGQRFLPATLAIDDPCVADELSLPTLTYSKTPDTPSGTEIDISGEISKRITEDFGISIGETWTHVTQPGSQNLVGFGDLETTFQYQLLKDNPHELALLLGLIVDWGGTGATNAGIGTSYSVMTPTFYFGKGLGDLPDTAGVVRPFAVTGQIGYQVPSSSFDLAQGVPIAQNLVYGGSLQYSMPYLKSSVVDLDLPDFINHLIPIVEAQFTTPAENNFGNSFVTTGTIQPGVIWVGSYFQVGIEAVVPVNRESGSVIGVMGQLHLYLDDMFPSTVGQPLLGKSTSPVRTPFGG
jgi:hypothetical protein